MVRILCYCVFLMTAALCGAAFFGQSSTQKKDADGDRIIHKPVQGSMEHVYHSGDSHILTDHSFKSVPVEEFERHLETSRTPADLYRIFFEDQNLTDFQIHQVLKMREYRLRRTGLERDVGFLGDEEEEEEEEEGGITAAYNHFRSMNENPSYRCRDPIPEVVCVEPNIGQTIRYYVPRCTILHRCHSLSGCCSRGYECQVKRIGVVRLPFLIYEETIEGSRVVTVDKSLVEVLSFTNHTECECRKIERDPVTCPRRCPTHFTKRVSSDGCHCDCGKNEVCRKIRRGELPLEESDLACIKSGECQTPTCTRGHFKVRTGFCPVVRD